MISTDSLNNARIAEAAGCSRRSVCHMRSKLRRFGIFSAPSKKLEGRPGTISATMLQALYERLLEKPDLSQAELAVFLWDELNAVVTKYSIGRALIKDGWAKTAACRIAKERHAGLRQLYFDNLSVFHSYHLVYVDACGYDKRIGFRRTTWSPLGVTPSEIPKLQRQQFQREQRYQVLPAYAQDGILLSSVFQGSTELTVFEDFIKQLLPLCGRWPQPKSVLVIDDVPVHHTDRIEQMCYDAGVKIVYLSPCSADLNPVEKWLAELRRIIKLNWQTNQKIADQGFDVFLQRCIATISSNGELAKHHFRKAGVRVKAS
ncbi:hypothetical protein V498_10594 [Pseudogymnoascus sp. VKM F-4517 (FW-2822)]|nr:hypothetical protein V498_10594 [Pseudogymnoascus sp. VKM F-4517 (FW-2822)]